MVIKKHEERKVITLYGDRGWHDPVSDGIDYDAGSILRGYRGINSTVNWLAKTVTIQSVSYSHEIFPSPGPVKTLRLFATVVYSGDLSPVFEKATRHIHRPERVDDTVIEVNL